MKKILTALCATGISAAVLATTFVPAQAGPVLLPLTTQAPALDAQSNIVQVDGYTLGKGNGYWRHGNRGFRADGGWRGRDGWRDRGGWRNHGGYYGRDYYRGRGLGLGGAAIGGLITGAIIGGALNNGPVYRERVYRGTNSHIQWCYDRYRSYRASDNTFQPYNGPRQQCYSPY